MLILDGEEGAQVFSAATKREQAEIVWKEARRMVGKSPDLRKAIKRHRNSLIFTANNSTFVPLSSDAQTLDGLNVSCAIIDEFHAHPNPDLWGVLDTATGSRVQPLIMITTTAGTNQFGVGFEIRSMMVDILNKNRIDDQWFGFIACIDQKDSYSDESCWIKANPNLPFIDTLLPDLKQQSTRASISVTQMNNFLVKRLNRWSQQEQWWLSIEDWDKCKAQFNYADMLGRPAFVGIDYAQVSDLSASCLCFPPITEGDKFRYLWKFYLPSDTIDKYTQNNDMRWREWVNSGELVSTIGTITDQSVMIEDVLQWSKDFDVRQVGFDPYNMRQFAAKAIEDGVEMVEIGQSMAFLNEPTKEFERQIVSKTLEHNGNSMMRWMIDNVSLDFDSRGNCMPHKPKKQAKGKKIDGVMAAVIACAVAVRNPIDINNSVGFFFA
jgi:phage terminase large subunit-like protein